MNVTSTDAMTTATAMLTDAVTDLLLSTVVNQTFSTQTVAPPATSLVNSTSTCSPQSVNFTSTNFTLTNMCGNFTTTPRPRVIRRRTPLSAYPEYVVARNIILYKHYILLPLAFISNGLLLMTSAKRMKQKAVYFYTGMLAIFDTLTIVMRGLLYLLLRNDVDIRLEGCRFFDFLGAAVGIIANWTLVAMTIERALVVLFPMKFAVSRGGIKWSVLVQTIIVTGAGLIKMRVLWLNSARYNILGNIECVGPKNRELALAMMWVDAAAYCFVPLILVVVFNSLIIGALAHASRTRRTLKEGTSRAARSNRIKPHKQLTIMLVVVSAMFALMTSPYFIYFLMRNTGPRPVRQTIYERIVSLLVVQVTELLLDLTHCVNFYLYCLAGRGFRKDLKHLFCVTICRQRVKAKATTNGRGITSTAQPVSQTEMTRL